MVKNVDECLPKAQDDVLKHKNIQFAVTDESKHWKNINLDFFLT